MALGTCVDTACTAGLTVELELEDGTVVVGIPEESADVGEHEPEIDDTGTRSYLVLAREVVMVRRVRRFSLALPA